MVHNVKKIASAAYGCAMARLALNMFLYFEEYPPNREWEAGSQEELNRRYMELLGWYLDGGQAKVLEAIEDFRGQVKQEMETVVAYSDAFQIYEYVLNRMERRFDDGLEAVEVEEGELTENLMCYLASAGDTTTQNQRIHEILRQLPVRFTRQKYFSMVHDAMTVYIGSGYAGLHEILYLLRSGSLIEYSQRRSDGYGKLNILMDQLKALSFKDLSKDAYQKAREQVEEASEILLALSEYCTCLEQLVNDLYILCLAGPEAVRDAKEEQAAIAILNGLIGRYGKGSQKTLEELSGYLPDLEGVQEEYYEKYQRLSARKEEQADQESQAAAKIGILMSTSPFAELEPNARPGCVTREELEREVAALFTELESVFASCQKPVMRAVMATTLSYLPVYFHSPEELQNHISNSISCCTDPAEKATCMELLLQMMETDGYELV